jgi:two-component system chemotaxis response regulator CheB
VGQVKAAILLASGGCLYGNNNSMERRLPWWGAQPLETGMGRRDIVVVGASVGGVQALRRLAAQLPAAFPASVCVVLHIGANASSLPALLAAAGPLPAEHPKSGQRLRPGRICLAPPDHHLLLMPGDELQLSRGAREHHTRPAIDPLFRSAALVAGPRVVGVLLTGRLDDGVAGLQAIKSCGGVVVVQDPDDAEDPGMPRAAMSAVQVDHCVPLHRMGGLLEKLVAEPADSAPARASPGLVQEHAAWLAGKNVMNELRAIGTPSTLVCPDCNGALWEITGTKPPRYRCHTGHGFSLSWLAAVHEESTEGALWSAIRALHEKEILLRKVAGLDRAVGDEPHAKQATERAERVVAQMEVLRKLAESG